MIKFRPTTIVPSELYVERSADAQLRSAVEDMGRPGYVLVARQMGKTNLLLKMKNEREEVGDLVYYADLSNRFETARGLFRSIIDGVCEVDPDLGGAAYSAIMRQRLSIDLEPNQEYDRHLRIILKSIAPRRLIVILDEVDSLTSVNYSDSIFAQIRSMYFSRANHPEYNRLTYVLSGVAEPTDLIKDKNISPFNIGQKIYLDDFTFSEVSELAHRSGLKFNVSVIERVFFWTSGSPRMTWDTFAELEKISNDTNRPNEADVDRIVQKLYLTRFDNAPVDAIRATVEADPQIRSAVISVRWGKGDTLSAKTLDRLYLAGITTPIADGPPILKNRIVDAALSDSWIEAAFKSNGSLLEAAAESFNQRAYRRSINLLEDHRASLSNGISLAAMPTFQLGMSYYYIGDYDMAIQNLHEAVGLASEEEHRAAINFYLGSAYLNVADLPAARRHFSVSAEFSGPLRFAALMGQVTAYLFHETKDGASVARRLAESLIESIELKSRSSSLSLAEIEVLTSAHASLHRIFTLLGDRRSARFSLANAFTTAPHRLKPALLVLQIGETPLGEQYDHYAVDAARIIIDEKLKFSQNHSAYLNFDEPYLALVVNRLVAQQSVEVALELLDHAARNLYSSAKSVLSVVVSLLHAIDGSPSAINPALAWFAADNLIEESTSLQLRFHVFCFLRKHTNKARESEAISIHRALIEEALNAEFRFTSDDIQQALDDCSKLVEQRRFDEVIDVARLGRRMLERVTSPPQDYSILFKFQEFSALHSLGLADRAKIIGQSILNDVDESFSGKVSVGIESHGTILLIRQRVVEALKSPQPAPIRISPQPSNVKYGRNDRVTVRDVDTGRSWTTKHKRVEDLVASGRVILVSVNRTSRK